MIMDTVLYESCIKIIIFILKAIKYYNNNQQLIQLLSYQNIKTLVFWGKIALKKKKKSYLYNSIIKKLFAYI